MSFKKDEEGYKHRVLNVVLIALMGVGCLIAYYFTDIGNGELGSYLQFIGFGMLVAAPIFNLVLKKYRPETMDERRARQKKEGTDKGNAFQIATGKCPSCFKPIARLATKCPHCTADL